MHLGHKSDYIVPCYLSNMRYNFQFMQLVQYIKCAQTFVSYSGFNVGI